MTFVERPQINFHFDGAAKYFAKIILGVVMELIDESMNYPNGIAYKLIKDGTNNSIKE